MGRDMVREAARQIEGFPEDMLLRLEHAILAPVESLEGIHALVKDTAALVDSMVAYLAQHEGIASNVQDAAAVLEFGKRVANKASELKGVFP